MSNHTPGPWVQVGPSFGNKVQEANARLIAAAPDLLDALEMVKEWDSSTHSESGAFSIPHEIRALIQSALAKAKGEL